MHFRVSRALVRRTLGSGLKKSETLTLAKEAEINFTEGVGFELAI
jgi:hypothetical protein